MGHVLNYTVGRRGHPLPAPPRASTVLRPMGFDSFGLPAENAAISRRRAPARDHRAEHRRDPGPDAPARLGDRLGPRGLGARAEYYRWTQWLFLKFLEAGLAYRKAAPVNWCPKDQTVLANEQVIDGRCELCGSVVEARNLEQWFFRITAYADALLDDHAMLDWPERTKTIQRNWIGRSEGAELLFRVEELDLRPAGLHDPLGHDLRRHVHGDRSRASAGRKARSRNRARGGRARVCEAHRRPVAEERATKEKDGVFSGREAGNPATGETIPIWVADYVLMKYGTGAIMAVPAHDERDFEFAQRVCCRSSASLSLSTARTRNRTPLRTPQTNGFDWGSSPECPRPKLHVRSSSGSASMAAARAAVSYRLRDWASPAALLGLPDPDRLLRQVRHVPIPEDELPVCSRSRGLRPKGIPPLASNQEWLHVPCPSCGGEGVREADTMDTFVDSSWYFLRYCDPHNDEAPFEREIVDYWMPVDQYIGGIDHATGHLLYSRFFVKVLNELGLVGFREPFARLFHQGWVRLGGSKMSKSRAMSTAPDQLAEMYGADAVRLFILFMGPADQDMEWSEEGVEGIARFLRRLWRLVNEIAAGAPGRRRRTARAEDARDDREGDRRHRPAIRFNTPIRR